MGPQRAKFAIVMKMKISRVSVAVAVPGCEIFIIVLVLMAVVSWNFNGTLVRHCRNSPITSPCLFLHFHTKKQNDLK